MEATPEAPAAENAVDNKLRPWPIEVRPNGTVIFDGIAIGGLDFTGGDALPDGVRGVATTRDGLPRLTINLGWLRLAGVHITVQDDPTVDHHRDGIVLER